MLLNSWNKNANLFRNASNNLNVFFHTPNKLLIFQVKIYNRICLIAGYPSNFPRYSPHLQIYQSTFPGHHNKPPIFRVIATCHQSQKRVPILCCFPPYHTKRPPSRCPRTRRTKLDRSDLDRHKSGTRPFHPGNTLWNRTPR